MIEYLKAIYEIVVSNNKFLVENNKFLAENNKLLHEIKNAVVATDLPPVNSATEDQKLGDN